MADFLFVGNITWVIFKLSILTLECGGVSPGIHMKWIPPHQQCNELVDVWHLCLMLESAIYSCIKSKEYIQRNCNDNKLIIYGNKTNEPYFRFFKAIYFEEQSILHRVYHSYSILASTSITYQKTSISALEKWASFLLIPFQRNWQLSSLKYQLCT